MKRIPLILLAATLLGSSAPIQDIPWHYTLEKPGDQWSQTSFDDSNWPEGYAGFGNRTTPGSRVSTDWKSSNIWLRQEVVLEALPAEPALYIFHDEDAVVYINGKIAATFKGFVTEYQLTPLSKEATSLLRKGKNLIAVQCEQVTGGQAIDVHLVDGKAAPELSPARLPKYPFKTELMTEWGSKVTPQNAWREYPRPALVRKEWIIRLWMALPESHRIGRAKSSCLSLSNPSSRVCSNSCIRDKLCGIAGLLIYSKRRDVVRS
jgi:hypothetical protein